MMNLARMFSWQNILSNPKCEKGSNSSEQAFEIVLIGASNQKCRAFDLKYNRSFTEQLFRPASVFFEMHTPT